MRKEILGVSWLNGQMKFMSARNGVPVATWEAPSQEGDSLNLTPVLQEAIRQTRYRGIDLALVLEHGRLIQQLVETPPAEGRDLEQFLERRVNQLKIFEEEAVWSFQVTQPTKRARALVLYLLPKPLMDQLAQSCRAADLHLLIMVSPTAVLGSQLAELPLGKDEIALVVAETEGMTSVVIGHKHGPIYLGRSLRCSWQTDPERVHLELNRTILFSKQHFGNTIESLWLFGAGAKEQLEPMRQVFEVPVRLSPVEHTPFYWAEQAVKLAPTLKANLISKDLQKAPQRRILVRITSVMLAFILAASALAFGWVEAQVQSQARTVTKLRAKSEPLQAQKDELQKRHEALEAKQRLVRLIEEQKLAPVPGWFLGYVVSNLPDELLLTELQVKRLEVPGNATTPPEDFWLVRLAGAAHSQPEATSTVARVAFSSFTNHLANGPFHLKITNLTSTFAPAETARANRAFGGLLPRLEPPRLAGRTNNQFVIEGIMR
jgi:cell division protein FtsB